MVRNRIQAKMYKGNNKKGKPACKRKMYTFSTLSAFYMFGKFKKLDALLIMGK